MTAPYLHRSQCWLFFCFWFMSVGCVPTKKTYEGMQPVNDSQLGFLRELWSNNDKFQIDFWQMPVDLDELAEVLVAPSTRTLFEAELVKRGIEYNVTNDDIQSAIEEEEPQTQFIVQRSNTHEGSSYFNFSQYNGWPEIEQYLHKLPELFPDLVQVGVLGQTHESRDLLLLKIGNNEAKKNKPAIWVDSGIHAREWISVASILYIIDSIVNYYGGDETIQEYLDNLVWYFLPVLNPDGYEHSRSKDRMWRKNRSPAVCISKGRKCCQGVDLNRNWATQWGMAGSSKDPCSEVYHGPKPFSEPETKAVRDFIMENSGSIKAYFTFHSYGQLWLHPFGYKKRTYPDDVEDLRKLSLAAVENMRAVHGSRYKVGTAANILYPSPGSADDWAKAEAKIKYVYSVELRPATGKGNGFILHPRNIVPTGEETWAGIRAVADRIISESAKQVLCRHPVATSDNVLITHVYEYLQSDVGEVVKPTVTDREKRTTADYEQATAEPATRKPKPESTTKSSEDEEVTTAENSEHVHETTSTRKAILKTTTATTATTVPTTTTTAAASTVASTHASTPSPTSTSTATSASTSITSTLTWTTETAGRGEEGWEGTTKVDSSDGATTTDEAEAGPPVEAPCYDLSTRCSQFEDPQEQCTSNAVKAICKKMCQQC